MTSPSSPETMGLVSTDSLLSKEGRKRMGQETSDVLLGVVGLAIFLLFVCAGGLALAAFNRRRYDKALAHLLPLISGAARSDGNAGLIAGTYEGRDVYVAVSPGVTTYRGFERNGEGKKNVFEIELRGVPGGRDWKVVYGRAWGVGRAEWRAETEDDALAERLRRAGVVELLSGMGNWPLVEFRAGRGALVYSEDIHPHLAPTSERFHQQLELLVALAHINERSNPA